MSAITRYQLRKGTKFVEFPYNEKRLKDAQQYRLTHPEYKHGRITGILQCLPSQIEIGKEYTFTRGGLPL